ncbi:MAG: ABC transporter permease [Halanaerobiales bacterium]|nr:ABC transporter permease [Halanaerobiales bacterium]
MAEKIKSQNQWAIVWRRLKKNRRAMVGLFIIIAVVLLALLAPYISPYKPTKISLRNKLDAPSKAHWFGTDKLGRDILSRMIYGSRISLLVGLVAVGISGTIGVLIGSIAGYYGKWIDNLLMRIVDILLAFPSILLAIALVAVLGPSLFNVILAISLVSWVGYARMVRGEFLSLKQQEFVEGARSLGAPDMKIIFRHILPNAISPVIVLATLGMAGAIISESSLSFLGLGVQPPTPSWGGMLSEGRTVIRQAWWVPTFPGIAIMFTVLAFNLLGDGLRDALDPKLKD